MLRCEICDYTEQFGSEYAASVPKGDTVRYRARLNGCYCSSCEYIIVRTIVEQRQPEYEKVAKQSEEQLLDFRFDHEDDFGRSVQEKVVVEQDDETY